VISLFASDVQRLSVRFLSNESENMKKEPTKRNWGRGREVKIATLNLFVQTGEIRVLKGHLPVQHHEEDHTQTPEIDLRAYEKKKKQ